MSAPVKPRRVWCGRQGRLPSSPNNAFARDLIKRNSVEPGRNQELVAPLPDGGEGARQPARIRQPGICNRARRITLLPFDETVAKALPLASYNSILSRAPNSCRRVEVDHAATRPRKMARPA
jgi:hypothetical protein